MYFKQFLHDETGCSSYLVASRQTREAAIVDPQIDIQPYLDLAVQRDYTIRHVVDTHLHADHLSGNRALAAATGASLWLHELADVRFPFKPLADGDVLSVGQIAMQVVHTPGHRPEAISLLVTNPARSPEPSILLSGDTLFVGDVGRPDFGGPEGAAQQYASVQKLLGLADYVEVFPAHFEGSCGRGMCGRPSTTVGFERRFNPLLQLSQDRFQALAAEASPRPLNMTAILDANRGAIDFTWPLLSHDTRLDAVPSLSPAEAATWLRERPGGARVVDVREPAEYAAGHLPEAINIPQADLALRLDNLPPHGEVLVVCQGGNRSLKAAYFLRAAGRDHVTNLSGGTTAWIAAGLPTATSTSDS
jgi:hydroxyacylglutathione hydrolase